MRSRSLLALIVLGGAVAAATWATGARALDPSKAEGDARAAREEAAQFCTSPRRPLSARARGLCPHAREIPSCEGFATACAEEESGAKTAPTTTAASSPPTSPPTSVVAAGLGGIAQVIVWLLVVGVVALVATLVARALLKLRSDAKIADPAPKTAAKIEAHADDAPPSVGDAEALLARADAHARRGEHDAALFTYLAAALRALDRRGAIRIARDRTNGEYVRGCRDEAARGPLREIVGDVDRVQFGGVEASASTVAHAKERASALVRAVPMGLVALALALATTACGAPPVAPAIKADDPAGSEIFVALLRKQGVTVSRATTSLATLPIPSDPGDAPTVVIDTERISLDDDTEAHLMRWVEAGGTLVLAGRSEGWPKELGASPRAADGERVTVWSSSDDEHDAKRRVGAPPPITATVARASAIAWSHPPLASFAGGEVYASMQRVEKGAVLGLATDELLTNAALARPGNAAALVAILEAIEPREVFLVRSEDAIAPPGNPISGMVRAGLGLGLVHALVFAAILFFAAGVRLARPKPTAPPARRAFAESIEASGALYARASMAPHALASYARFVDERLRARMPRRESDVAAFLAARAGADPARCDVVWQRAKNARATEPARGDELELLKELTALYAATTRQEGRG